MKGAVYFDQTFEFALFLIVGRKQSKLRYQSTLSNFVHHIEQNSYIRQLTGN
jgi:hypothetical protein